MKIQDLKKEYDASESIPKEGGAYEYEKCKFKLINSVCEYLIDTDTLKVEVSKSYIDRHYINRLQEITNILRESENDIDITASLQELVYDMVNEYLDEDEGYYKNQLTE